MSCYLDLAHRLETADLAPVFAGAARLAPCPTDLSYYNYDTGASAGLASPYFELVLEGEDGLAFKHKRDRKLISLDPAAPPGDSTTREELHTDEYLQCTFFDHHTRRG